VEILEWVARRGRRRERGRRILGAGCNDRAKRSAECFRGQLPFCLAPSTVALILALAGVARWAEIAADIGAALRALANAKIHSNATHSSISTVSQRGCPLLVAQGVDGIQLCGAVGGVKSETDPDSRAHDQPRQRPTERKD